MPLSEQSKERLRETVEFIGLEPRRLRMNRCLNPDSSSPCGTVGCLYGWRMALDAIASGKPKPITIDWKDDIDSHAEDPFGLSSKQRDRLAFVNKWPSPFRMLYAFTQNFVLVVSVIAVEHFIATDGAE